MKCHEYCQAMFDEVFMPVLGERFAEVLPRLSVGLVGWGSDVLGGDDDLSRDHNWGHGRCQLLLAEGDVERYGPDISAALVAAVPAQFHGLETAKLEPQVVPVGTIDSIYRDLFGFSTGHPPDTHEEWARIGSGALCFASSGYAIYDPSGALTARMSEFRDSYYPTDVWKWEIARHLWDVWHFGAYNSADRLACRGDGEGLLIAQGHFVESTMAVLILLNRQYPAYWKWFAWQFRRLPKWTDRLGPMLLELAGVADCTARGQTIRDMCQVIRDILHEAGLLPDPEWRNFMGSLDILGQIESPEVRAFVRTNEPHLDVW